MQMKSYLKVRDYIWEKISKGELKLGDKLPPEREFAEILDISRNSVREGIKLLESMGVICSHHGSGNFVSGNFEKMVEEILTFMFTLNEMKERQITEFRYGIEWEAVNIITGNLTDEMRDKFSYCLSQLDKSTTEEEAVNWDKNFHYLIVEATDNYYIKTSYLAISKIMDNILPRLREKIIVGMKSHHALRSAHRMMLEGIIEGNLEKSMEGTRNHFNYIMEFQDK